MKCAQCSASVLVALVPGGVSAWKIAERAREAATKLDAADKSAVHLCADTLNWLAAELARLKEERR
jgi:hypothetical protein